MDVAPLAKPITPENNIEEEKITKKSEHELNYDKIKYNLSLILLESNKLILKMKEMNSFTTSYYISINTLEDLSKIDKQFRSYDTEGEVFETLNDILNTNQALIQKSNENFSINFCFPLPGNKKKEILIPLKSKNCEQKNISNEIIKKINDLEIKLNKEIEENKENKKIIEEYKAITEENQKTINKYKKIIEENQKNIIENKDIIIELRKEINQLKNDINELKKKEIERKKNEEEKEKYFESNIIKEKREYELIENRLKITGYNKKIKYKLLYRASVDGDKAKTFHEKCDGIRGTLSLVKTTKNMKFGGYTEAIWNSNGYQKDEKAFCFSLNLNKIYNISKLEEAIQPQTHLGPRFANTLFGIYDEAFKKGDKGGWCSYTSDTQYGTINNREITGGESVFGISEVEVYQIIFE